MANLKEIITIALTALQLSCYNKGITKETVIPDEFNIYKLAYPDMSFHVILREEILWFNGDIMLIRMFDSNFNNKVDLSVFYYLKNYDRSTKKYEINFDKIPLIILKDNSEGSNPNLYVYNREKRQYEFISNYRIYWKSTR